MRLLTVPGLLIIFAASTARANLAPNQLANYPRSWVKTGECLDNNVGPLVLGTTPPDNPNVIDTVEGVINFNDCADKCANHSDCRFFTYYREKIPLETRLKEYNCSLVGYNLRHACFYLEKTCVLLKHCRVFKEECQSCRTGVRALHQTCGLPRTLILNGITDNRKYKAEGKDQYSEDEANIAELIVNTTTTCLMSTQLVPKVVGAVTETQIKPRFGSSAIFVHDKIFNCGGYSNKEKKYLADCQAYTNGSATPWDYTAPLSTANGRAFGSMVATKKDVAYYMGGYNKDDGFLDTIEKVASSGAWSALGAAFNMPEKKSHFCTVYDDLPDIRDEKWLYVMGGWNINYLSSIHKIKVGTADGLLTGSWETYATGLSEARSDHACALVQHGWTRGILVAGGYRTDGAWMEKVEFLDLERGAFLSPDLFPRLNEGRHYNGIANVDFMPFVFGGWNNGSMASLEYLDERSPTPVWKNVKAFNLRVAREKFAAVEVPYSFMPDCP